MAKQKFNKLLDMSRDVLVKATVDLSAKINESIRQVHAGNNENIRTVRNLKKDLARHLTALQQVSAKEDK